MVSDATLNEIRNRLGIVELVGEYVQLKKSGQGYMGLCPFHKEKSPSFHVHPLKQCFHCFGCQKGGNIFTFYMAIEGLKFPECVEKLAKRTGVTLEQERNYRPEPARGEDPSRKRCLAIHEWAAKYFHYLLTEVPEYRFALDYVRSRGLTEKTIHRFRLGVSPKGWNKLMSLMLERNYSLQELVTAGLVKPKENSPTQGYDTFRQRLMFPITDPDGAIIGFGARQLNDEPNQPKYINSPESPLFSKRRVLYGLHESQRGIRLRGEALIVEGYMDVVGLHECGIENAVATMGTAVTEEHCVQLKALTRRAITIFDPDAAGLDAWHRSVHLFITSGIFAKDLSLPEGKDPDEFALQNGPEKFYQLCEKAPRQMTKLLREIAARGPLSEEESSRILSELTPILIASRRLPDRALLWDDISLVLKVSLGALKEIAEGASFRAVKGEPVSAPPAQRQRIDLRPTRPPKGLNPVDLEFFRGCLQCPEEFLKLPKAEWQGGLVEPRIRQWLERMSAEGRGQFESILGELIQQETDEPLLAIASAGLFPGEGTSSPKDSLAFLAVTERIRRRKRELEIRSLSAQVKLTQRLGNDEEQMRLLAQLKELRSS